MDSVSDRVYITIDPNSIFLKAEISIPENLSLKDESAEYIEYIVRGIRTSLQEQLLPSLQRSLPDHVKLVLLDNK